MTQPVKETYIEKAKRLAKALRERLSEDEYALLLDITGDSTDTIHVTEQMFYAELIALASKTK